MKCAELKRICAALCIFSALFTLLCINTNASQQVHWYCKRTMDHTQPLVDGDLSWIENYNGIYIDRVHDDQNEEKVVYLTFDAGYENGNVEKILDVLHKENVPAAFFILTNLIDRNPELVKRMAAEGHLVCNHTSKHKNITSLTKTQLLEEIQALEYKYTGLTGALMAKYFRPPEGTFDQNSLSMIQDLGYKTVFWSFAYADWDNRNQMSPETATKKIMDHLHNGEIMLLHPTSATNAEILQDVICQIKAQGYRFGTLDEIVLT